MKAAWRSASNRRWRLNWREVGFTALPTPFRHLGFFPDMAPVWDWLRERTAGIDQPEFLNLFGYTGVGTLAMAASRPGDSGGNKNHTRPPLAA